MFCAPAFWMIHGALYIAVGVGADNTWEWRWHAPSENAYFFFFFFSFGCARENGLYECYWLTNYVIGVKLCSLDKREARHWLCWGICMFFCATSRSLMVSWKWNLLVSFFFIEDDQMPLNVTDGLGVNQNNERSRVHLK